MWRWRVRTHAESHSLTHHSSTLSPALSHSLFNHMTHSSVPFSHTHSLHSTHLTHSLTHLHRCAHSPLPSVTPNPLPHTESTLAGSYSRITSAHPPTRSLHSLNDALNHTFTPLMCWSLFLVGSPDSVLTKEKLQMTFFKVLNFSVCLNSPRALG